MCQMELPHDSGRGSRRSPQGSDCRLTPCYPPAYFCRAEKRLLYIHSYITSRATDLLRRPSWKVHITARPSEHSATVCACACASYAPLRLCHVCACCDCCALCACGCDGERLPRRVRDCHLSVPSWALCGTCISAHVFLNC